MKVSLTFGAGAAAGYVSLDDGAAGRTLHLLAKGHHLWRPRTFVFLRLRFWGLRSSLWFAIVFLISTLPIFAIAHSDGPFQVVWRCAHIIGEIRQTPKRGQTKSVTRPAKGARMRGLCGLISSFLGLSLLHS